MLVDEHISWIDHIDTLENKLPKNLGLLYKAKKPIFKCQGNEKFLILLFP